MIAKPYSRPINRKAVLGLAIAHAASRLISRWALCLAWSGDSWHTPGRVDSVLPGSAESNARLEPWVSESGFGRLSGCVPRARRAPSRSEIGLGITGE